jgi:putative transposase
VTGAWICFEDEAGQSLRPGKARTWAPRGRTPVTLLSGNAGRLPVAGMACLKPGRPGRFFYRVLHVHRRRKGSRASLSEADHAALVTAAHRALNAPVVLVWDNLNTHRSQKMRRFTEANSDWLTVVHLPAYAPDLNAVEGAWASMKSSSATTPRPPSTSSRPWSAAASAASSAGPASSTPSSARPASASNPRRPSEQTLAFQPL